MKNIIKKTASYISFILILPFYIIYKITSLFTKGDGLFPCMSQFFSLIPGICGDYIRKAFYRLALKYCSADCCISFGVLFFHPDAEIGAGVYIGERCTLGTVTLGRNVLLGSNVDIPSGKRQHGFKRLDIPIKEQERRYDRVTVGEDTWIGNSAVITSDIGSHCVIGAGSVVMHPVENYSVALGNPARIVKKRQQ